MRTRLAPFVAVLALVACDDAAGPEGARLTGEEITTLSGAMVEEDFAYTGEVTAGQPPSAGVAADPVTSTTEFSGTRPCPLGGQVAMEGTRVRTWDAETQTGTGDLSLVKTHEACARNVRNVTVTLVGDPDIAVEAHHAWQVGVGWIGLQTLSIEGGFAWSTDDGREGSCLVDIDAVFDPETLTRTVSGTFCEHTFEQTTTWSGGRGSDA